MECFPFLIDIPMPRRGHVFVVKLIPFLSDGYGRFENERWIVVERKYSITWNEIGIFTREADIFIAPALTADHGYEFLKQSMGRRFDGHVHLLQTDGGPEFKETFKFHIGEYCDRHRVARPYKKNEQSYIESFNRTVRKECLGWTKYRIYDQLRCTGLVEAFLDRYHYDRPHMGLGMRPPLSKP